MPELPEVETTLNGIAPYLSGQTLSAIKVRDRRLRWPVTPGLEGKAKGQKVRYLERRGKYILLGLEQGGLLIHLGMSGSMRVLAESAPPQVHDHFDLETSAGKIIRFRDPRRFGCLLWHPDDVRAHPRLKRLGVEPLSDGFSGKLLYDSAQGRRVAIKNLIMNGEIVVGVGNIYASESLFDAGIHPSRGCHRVSLQRYERLSQSIRKILSNAIKQGGTTLKDFVRVDGSPGYFEQKLHVYGREREGCDRCDGEIHKSVIGQRATYYCARCQR
ncbi:MAG: bifunctional DNA-formamidopyrimidine glycosylase/DNA-(apurinic or apyrimidinic site) lyase [bacterium]